MGRRVPPAISPNISTYAAVRSKFWMAVLTDVANRGLEETLRVSDDPV